MSVLFIPTRPRCCRISHYGLKSFTTSMYYRFFSSLPCALRARAVVVAALAALQG
jgi:hypothetical protein